MLVLHVNELLLWFFQGSDSDSDKLVFEQLQSKKKVFAGSRWHFKLAQMWRYAHMRKLWYLKHVENPFIIFPQFVGKLE